MRVLLATTLLLAGDAFADGVRAYQAGRFDEARIAFATAARTAGAEVSAELLYDEALAALHAGALDEAETSARRAAEFGGDELRARCDLLNGGVAFERGRKAEAELDAPGAPTAKYDRAIALTEVARDAWQRAAMGREPSPAASRNAERALVRLVELERRRSEADREQAGGDSRRDAPPSPPPPDSPNAPPALGAGAEPDAPRRAPTVSRTPAPRTDAREHELSQAEVDRLFEKLDEKEKTKLLLRRARRQSSAESSGQSPAERDW